MELPARIGGGRLDDMAHSSLGPSDRRSKKDSARPAAAITAVPDAVSTGLSASTRSYQTGYHQIPGAGRFREKALGRTIHEVTLRGPPSGGQQGTTRNTLLLMSSAIPSPKPRLN
jgi:hypothetical protein